MTATRSTERATVRDQGRGHERDLIGAILDDDDLDRPYPSGLIPVRSVRGDPVPG